LRELESNVEAMIKAVAVIRDDDAAVLNTMSLLTNDFVEELEERADAEKDELVYQNDVNAQIGVRI
jgi:hypothetical protein